MLKACTRLIAVKKPDEEGVGRNFYDTDIHAISSGESSLLLRTDKKKKEANHSLTQEED